MFRSMEIALNLIKYFLVNQYNTLLFMILEMFINIYIFRHLKLEIALAISPLNDDK